MDKNYGTLKIFIIIEVNHGVTKRMDIRSRLICVQHTYSCTLEEAKDRVKQFKEMNSTLPLYKAEWTQIERLDLNSNAV